ncbi:MAG: hypothetical protein P8P30_09730 [Rickettsiales bacterium]|nr:hypothetical protein [Rickettsiales bacterium]
MTLKNKLHILQDQFQLRPVFAAELEFYVRKTLPEETILQTLNEICTDCYPAEKERGKTQYEIATKTFTDIPTFIETLEALRQTIGTELVSDFSAKPYPQDYGSALHFHLHLEDLSGINTFTRNEYDEYSAPMLHTLGGLLATMQQHLSTFSPNDTSRFETHGKHSPTHLSWGPNNRSVALRLPDKPRDDKHIEHRLSAADAYIEPCVNAILAGTLYGLQNQSNPGQPIYGNAWDTQYRLEPIV